MLLLSFFPFLSPPLLLLDYHTISVELFGLLFAIIGELFSMVNDGIVVGFSRYFLYVRICVYIIAFIITIILSSIIAVV